VLGRMREAVERLGDYFIVGDKVRIVLNRICSRVENGGIDLAILWVARIL
jgi:hypothetical protein